MKLSRLHEEFMERARRPMNFDRLPVSPILPDPPIVVTNRWSKSDDTLKKSYQFRESKQRNDFVRQLLDYEQSVGHHAVIRVEEDRVGLVLQTKDIKQVTELDREYAAYADELYRDTVYSSDHDGR